ncbi:Predicted membrane protein [Reichenbachiella faecimaris]|uniref:Predicted membrane protein n=1 Tax=Reichenbachiella faecimaris TaxID=692418 RepID=A0A1W2G761_REIFA|nr:DUF2339 domain-containing protein [Reichenbachiella faecimaris]SMD32431.1 Predicted membrane protein [Reichenbachiella faecimaris]
MEGFIILLLIVLLIMVVRLMDRIDKIDTRVKHIHDEVLGEMDGRQPKSVKQPVVEKPKPAVEPPKEVVKEKVPDPVKELIAQSQAPKAAAVRPKRKVVSKPPRPSFMERNPDLEKFIGENLLSKIGIVIFVIGMGFLVKLGIDNEVISESMRVAIGILIGGGMIGLAHYMRTSFSKFSSILVGGALAVLYFTIALAFHEYALIPQTAAFIIMVFITAFGVLLSVAYDRKELAVLAIIGGFGTPFFVSTGSGNFSVLLTYILILDIGMLALVYFKKWNVINYLAYGFTYLLFLGVYFTKFIDNQDETRFPLFLFLTAFYLIFFLMTIIYNVKNSRKFKYPEIMMLLTNSSLYFGLGLGLVQGYKEGLLSGLFTALVAIFNFGFAFVLYRRKDIDKNLLFLLIGLVLTFVSLIAPIQLEGNYITLFWAVEAVLLLWLSQKSGIQLMKAASALITILMLISLTMDWQQNYYPRYDYVVLQIFLNKAFMASFVAMTSLIGSMFLMKADETFEIKGMQLTWRKSSIQVLFALVFYLGFAFELHYQFLSMDWVLSKRLILLGIYNYIYVLLVVMVARTKPSALLEKASFGLSVLAVGSYLTYYLSAVNYSISFHILDDGLNTGFYWHYVMLILFVLILMSAYQYIQKNYTFQSKIGHVSLWVLAFIGVFVSSAEVGHLSMLYQFGSGKEEYEAYDAAVRSVYPVVWALSALILMVVGMKLRMKPLRLASLVVFTITIAKLFFYDLAGNSTGKIISFILLGVILLLISFLYQKLKFIIQDDEKKN